MGGIIGGTIDAGGGIVVEGGIPEVEGAANDDTFDNKLCNFAFCPPNTEVLGVVGT